MLGNTESFATKTLEKTNICNICRIVRQLAKKLGRLLAFLFK